MKTSGFGSAGKAIKDIPRDEVIIASKWGPMIDGKHNFTHDGSPAYARKALQLSLKNLGVDYIDLYILRSKDAKVPIEESVKAMAVCIVRSAAVSTAWTVALRLATSLLL